MYSDLRTIVSHPQHVPVLTMEYSLRYGNGNDLPGLKGVCHQGPSVPPTEGVCQQEPSVPPTEGVCQQEPSVRPTEGVCQQGPSVPPTEGIKDLYSVHTLYMAEMIDSYGL